MAKIRVTQVKLNKDGYDRRGRYWGIGEALYYSEDVADAFPSNEQRAYTRARSVEGARQIFAQRLQPSSGMLGGLMLGAGLPDRASYEKAIYKAFPPDSKRKVGKQLKVMLTGDTAKAVGKSQHSVVTLDTLTDAQIEALHRLLVR